MKYEFVTNAIQVQLYHYQFYTHTTEVLISEHMTWWLMKIVLERGFLRLKSSMYILLRILWHTQWHEIHVFQFLSILKSFDRCDILHQYIQVLSYCNCNLMFVCFACLDCEYGINILYNFFLKIRVWNILQCCIIALKELHKHKVQCELLAKGHKINFGFVEMIL
jgi:hypothetical protein